MVYVLDTMYSFLWIETRRFQTCQYQSDRFHNRNKTMAAETIKSHAILSCKVSPVARPFSFPDRSELRRKMIMLQGQKARKIAIKYSRTHHSRLPRPYPIRLPLAAGNKARKEFQPPENSMIRRRLSHRPRYDQSIAVRLPRKPPLALRKSISCPCM